MGHRHDRDRASGRGAPGVDDGRLVDGRCEDHRVRAFLERGDPLSRGVERRAIRGRSGVLGADGGDVGHVHGVRTVRRSTDPGDLARRDGDRGRLDARGAGRRRTERRRGTGQTRRRRLARRHERPADQDPHHQDRQDRGGGLPARQPGPGGGDRHPTTTLPVEGDRGARPQVSGGLRGGHRAQEPAVAGIRLDDGGAVGARREMTLQPGRIVDGQGHVETIGAERPRPLVGGLGVVVPAGHHRAVPVGPGVPDPRARSAAASRSASNASSAASAWRRLSRARVRSARAAT